MINEEDEEMETEMLMLKWMAEGIDNLVDLAVVLRSNAEVCEVWAAEGYALVQPVENGYVITNKPYTP